LSLTKRRAIVPPPMARLSNLMRNGIYHLLARRSPEF
jgi:hypothetical protein